MTWEYIAGFFDGEGCVIINVANKSGRPDVGICIAQANYPLLVLIKDFIGFGQLSQELSSKKSSGVWWQYRISAKSEVKSFLDKIIPHLILKKAESQIASALCNLSPGKGFKFSDEETLKQFKLVEAAKKIQADRKQDRMTIQ